MKIITTCRVCKSRQIKRFLDLGDQPYANSLLKSPQEKEKSYPLSLNFCQNCSLVQLDHTPDPKELFSNYIWVTGTSNTARMQAKVWCRKVTSRIKSKKKGYILEVASNDGTFLLPFIKKGYTVLGVDPAKNIAKVAVAAGVSTRCEFFGVASAKKILKEMGPAQVVFARNVLAHVANTLDFVKGMEIVLDDDGLLVIEVHYAKKIYQELHYDSIYHEHLCYFTVKSLEKLLSLHNLFIEDVTTSPISGGALIVYARKRKVKESAKVGAFRKAEERIKLNALESWENFAQRIKKHKENFLEILEKYKGKTVVGYGASARSSTLLNYCGISTKQIAVIADQNSWKQGLYTAGTHIPIKSLDFVMEKKPQVFVILSWNYKNEIMNNLKNTYKYKGKCVIPLPNSPKVI